MESITIQIQNTEPDNGEVEGGIRPISTEGNAGTQSPTSTIVNVQDQTLTKTQAQQSTSQCSPEFPENNDSGVRHHSTVCAEDSNGERLWVNRLLLFGPRELINTSDGMSTTEDAPKSWPGTLLAPGRR